MLAVLGMDFEGPPVKKIVVARGRTELEIPGIRIGDSIILKKKVDQEVEGYLAASRLFPCFSGDRPFHDVPTAREASAP